MQDTPPLKDRIAQFEQELQCYESSYRRIDVPEDPSGFDRVERELLEESGGVQEQIAADYLLGKFNRADGNEGRHNTGLPEQPSGPLYADLYCYETLSPVQQSESLAPDYARSAQRGYWRDLSSSCRENSTARKEMELGRKRQTSSTTVEEGESGREKEEGARRSLSRTRDSSKTECRDEIESTGLDSKEEAPRKRRRRGK